METARRERKCVVDLTGVTFIVNVSWERALTELCKEGAELIATGVYTRHVVCTTSRRKKSSR